MASARNITEPLASTMLMPNQRRRLSSRTTIGPRPMPTARPMKRVANNSEKAASPAPSDAVKKRAVPITMPPPANAPKMPSTRPRTSGVPPM
jgi:hypothetical protein